MPGDHSVSVGIAHQRERARRKRRRKLLGANPPPCLTYTTVIHGQRVEVHRYPAGTADGALRWEQDPGGAPCGPVWVNQIPGLRSPWSKRK